MDSRGLSLELPLCLRLLRVLGKGGTTGRRARPLQPQEGQVGVPPTVCHGHSRGVPRACTLWCPRSLMTAYARTQVFFFFCFSLSLFRFTFSDL